MSRVTHRQTAFSTRWFNIVAKTIEGQTDPHYSLETLDYVSILATTTAGEVLLVKQYRPVVEGVTLELPSGHVERGETPDQAARRELLEETGCRAQEMTLLGNLIPDTGRLGNTLWCFVAPHLVAAPAASTEEGLEVVAYTPAQLKKSILDGEFKHALHLAVMLLAVEQGSFRFS